MHKRKATAICLPMSRTARIMNSAIGVDCVNQDMVALATKATEIFIKDLTRKAYELSDDSSNSIGYEDVQRLVHKEPQYDFLVDWIPKRMKFSEALNMHKQNKQAVVSQQEPPNIVTDRGVDIHSDHERTDATHLGETSETAKENFSDQGETNEEEHNTNGKESIEGDIEDERDDEYEDAQNEDEQDEQEEADREDGVGD